MYSARGSIKRANINGDRGHPCLVPFVIENVREKKPEVKTLAEGLEYNEETAEKIGPEKPNFPSTLWR